jgi:hypothetical protein
LTALAEGLQGVVTVILFTFRSLKLVNGAVVLARTCDEPPRGSTRLTGRPPRLFRHQRF